MEEVRSIKFLYDYFIKKHNDKVLGSIYFFSYVKFPVEALTMVTVSIVLSLVLEELKNNTIFITFDNTLQGKYGNKVKYLSSPVGYLIYSKKKYSTKKKSMIT